MDFWKIRAVMLDRFDGIVQTQAFDASNAPPEWHIAVPQKMSMAAPPITTSPTFTERIFRLAGRDCDTLIYREV